MYLAMRQKSIPEDFDISGAWVSEFGCLTKDLPDSELGVIDHEMHGGPCLKCRTPWVKDGQVYRQDCDCYCECPFCHRRMIVEEDENIRGCIYCGGFQCANSEKKTEYHGKKAEVSWVRCQGILRPTMRGWYCDECKKQYGNHFTWPSGIVRPGMRYEAGWRDPYVRRR